MARANGSSSKSVDKSIVTAAEMIFNGATHNEVAEVLSVTSQRVFQYTKAPLYTETIAKLQAAKDKIESQIAQKQIEHYVDEFEEWQKQSRQMGKVSAATYSKIMTIVNSALDVAQSNPDKVKATEQVKHVPNLVKAAIALQQQIDQSFNYRLGIDEINRRINKGEVE